MDNSPLPAKLPQAGMSVSNFLRTSLGFVPTDTAEHLGTGRPHVEQVFLTNTRIASSVLLQQCLFYSYYFSPCWMVANLVSYTLKEHKREDELTWIFGSIWLLFEPLRLYCGFTGNLQEKVPFLVVFTLMTGFPDLPVNVYLGLAQKTVWPFDTALATFTLLFLLLQLFVSIFAIRNLIRSQDEKFYLEDYERPVKNPLVDQNAHLYDVK